MKTWVARLIGTLLGVALILKLSESWVFDASAWLTQVHFHDKDFDDEIPAFYEPSIKTEVSRPLNKELPDLFLSK